MNYTVPDQTEYTDFYENILIASQNLTLNQPKANKVYLPYSIVNKFNDFHNTNKGVQFCGSNLGKMYFQTVDTTVPTSSRVFTYYVIDESNYSISNIVKSRSDEFSFILTYKDYFCANGMLNATQCQQTQPKLQCINFYGNATDQQFLNNYIQIGSSYLDDFMYSNKSSDIFITALYFFIPIFLFILGMKVFRKGLFK